MSPQPAPPVEPPDPVQPVPAPAPLPAPVPPAEPGADDLCDILIYISYLAREILARGLGAGEGGVVAPAQQPVDEQNEDQNEDVPPLAARVGHLAALCSAIDSAFGVLQPEEPPPPPIPEDGSMSNDACRDSICGDAHQLVDNRLVENHNLCDALAFAYEHLQPLVIEEEDEESQVDVDADAYQGLTLLAMLGEYVRQDPDAPCRPGDGEANADAVYKLCEPRVAQGDAAAPDNEQLNGGRRGRRRTRRKAATRGRNSRRGRKAVKGGGKTRHVRRGRRRTRHPRRRRRTRHKK